MYAIIDDGGMQFKVAEGDAIAVGLRDAQPGDAVSFDRVLLISDAEAATVGTPVIVGATVEGEVVDEVKGSKIVVQRFQRRQGMHTRKQGHRQRYTNVVIKRIVPPGGRAEETPGDEAPVAEPAAPEGDAPQTDEAPVTGQAEHAAEAPAAGEAPEALAASEPEGEASQPAEAPAADEAPEPDDEKGES